MSLALCLSFLICEVGVPAPPPGAVGGPLCRWSDAGGPFLIHPPTPEREEHQAGSRGAGAAPCHWGVLGHLPSG